MNRFALVLARQHLPPLVVRTCLKAGAVGAVGAMRHKSSMPMPDFVHHHPESRLNHTKFGNISEIPETALVWPTDFRMRVESGKGHVLDYKMVDGKEADRVAEIFEHATGEVRGVRRGYSCSLKDCMTVPHAIAFCSIGRIPSSSGIIRRQPSDHMSRMAVTLCGGRTKAEN